MKQVVQHLRDGRTELLETPAPWVRPGHLIIRTSRSLVSPGTERMLREFGKAGLISKARQQPDRVRQVLDKVRTDGLLPTIDSVRAKLDQPIPLGYCNVGRVLDAAGAEGFNIGDRVVSNGPHSEIVRVPKNLVARVPDAVDDDTAAFTVLGAIALEGIRLAQPTLGESVAVIGLGLVGLLTVQLLIAQGARVLAYDLDEHRCALARNAGAEAVCVRDRRDVSRAADAFSRSRGMDAVLICAATKSNDPIVDSAQMLRQRGRVVLVGVVGLDVPRDEFFRKELSLQVSCSYGPGRYDPAYEEKGQDYPLGFVRWTAQRNFEAVLDSMAAGRIDVSSYISHRAPIGDAVKTYEALDGNTRDVLGILFEYPSLSESPTDAERTVSISQKRTGPAGKRVGFIGAGNYATRMLIPAFRKAGGAPLAICGSGTAAEVYAARKFGFATVTSSPASVIENPDVDLVAIATRHDSHCEYVLSCLEKGRPVFVEKPLALTDDEIERVAAAYRKATSPFLMVGFNRRFSPFAVHIAEALHRSSAPPAIAITVNAGSIPANHWTQDRAVGGGRIIGEACHFVDLARFFAASPITDADCFPLRNSSATVQDSATISLAFKNGAIASINYLSNGHRGVPKERVEVFCDGKVWIIDNFRRVRGFGASGLRGGLTQDKGQNAMAAAVLAALYSGLQAPIPFDELREVSQVTIALDRKLSAV